VNQFAVRDAVLARRRGDADDPQRTEVALFQPPADIRELQAAFRRLFGVTVQLALVLKLTFGDG
jgi:hypothetical protein